MSLKKIIALNSVFLGAVLTITGIILDNFTGDGFATLQYLSWGLLLSLVLILFMGAASIFYFACNLLLSDEQKMKVFKNKFKRSCFNLFIIGLYFIASLLKWYFTRQM